MIKEFLDTIMHNKFMLVMGICIILDTVLGILKACKQRKLNSAFGIDGIIRKATMIVSSVFLMFFDTLVGFNVISWLPQTFKDTAGLTKIGVGEFYCILFTIFEALSCLKNLYTMGCPTPKWLKNLLEDLLENMTGEVKPDIKEAKNENK